VGPGARSGLELDHLVALLWVLVHQLAHDDGADMDLDRLVRDISCDPGLGQEFDILRRPHGARDRSVDHYMGYIDVALDFCKLRDDQGPRLAADGLHVALHVPVDAKAASEGDIAFDDRARPDQAVDGTR